MNAAFARNYIFAMAFILLGFALLWLAWKEILTSRVLPLRGEHVTIVSISEQRTGMPGRTGVIYTYVATARFPDGRHEQITFDPPAASPPRHAEREQLAPVGSVVRAARWGGKWVLFDNSWESAAHAGVGSAIACFFLGVGIAGIHRGIKISRGTSRH